MKKIGYNDYWVRFMSAKAHLIKASGCDVEYMLDENYKTIKLAPREKCKIAWDEMRDIIFSTRIYGLCGEVCYFCLVHNDFCLKCSYKKLHLQCASVELSDFNKITGSLNTSLIFSNDFYRKLIKHIEAGQ